MQVNHRDFFTARIVAEGEVGGIDRLHKLQPDSTRLGTIQRRHPTARKIIMTLPSLRSGAFLLHRGQRQLAALIPPAFITARGAADQKKAGGAKKGSGGANADTGGAKIKHPKVKKKTKGRGDSKESSESEDKILKTLIACLDAPTQKEPPQPPDEMARRFQVGRNYGIGMLLDHNKENHDIMCKIHLKNHAIKMLPKNTRLREEALKIRQEMPPEWRHLPVWEPPIPGIDPRKMTQTIDEEEFSPIKY
jgi:hypothetical protein